MGWNAPLSFQAEQKVAALLTGQSRLQYFKWFARCESGEIGRRTRLRIWRGNPWGFESPLSHQLLAASRSFLRRPLRPVFEPTPGLPVAWQPLVAPAGDFFDVTRKHGSQFHELRRDDVQMIPRYHLDFKVAHQISPNRGRISSCLLYTSPSPRDRTRSRMPSSA